MSINPISPPISIQRFGGETFDEYSKSKGKKRSIEEVEEPSKQSSPKKMTLPVEIEKLRSKLISKDMELAYRVLLDDFNQILRRHPNHSSIFISMIGIYQNIEDYEEARRLCRSLLEREPNNTDALIMMARSYFFEEKTAEGLRIFEQLLEINPESTLILLERATFYETNEEYENALKDYLKIYQIKKTMGALIKCGQMSHKLRNFDDSLNFYNQFLSSKPDDDFVLSERAKIYSELGEYEKALNDYHQIFTKYSKIPESDIEGIKHLYFKAGKELEKFPIFQNLLKLYPDIADLSSKSENSLNHYSVTLNKLGKASI